MGNESWAKNASILVLLGAAVLAPSTVSAGGHKQHSKNANEPSAGYPVPIPAAHSLSGVIFNPTYSGCCYTFPIQSVYKCPAVLAGQPGSQVEYLRSEPWAGFLGGQPYLYHH